MKQNEKGNIGATLRRVLSILMAVLLIMSTVSVALASEGEGDFDYEPYEYWGEYEVLEGISITGYNGDDENIVIPETIDGQTVLSIDGLNLWENETVVSVTIPETVVHIYGGFAQGARNFENIFVDADNEYFESVDGVLFNEDMTEILSYPSAKGTSYEIPEGVTVISDNAFYGCENLSEIKFPFTLTTIYNYAFCYSGIKEAVFEGELEYIGYGAFSNCNNLQKVSIPENVYMIEDEVFSYTPALEEITVHEDSEYYCAEDNVLYNKDKTSLVRYAPTKEGTSFTIPETVVSVETGAFADAESLSEVNFPEGLKSVGRDILGRTAIYNDEANWPSGEVGFGPFYYKNILLGFGSVYDGESYEIFEVKAGTEYIAEGFDAWDAVEVILPEGLVSIGREVFGWSSVEKVNIPDSVEYIGERAFFDAPVYNNGYDEKSEVVYIDGCAVAFNSGENESVTLKDGTRLIAEGVFRNVDSLSEITIPGTVAYVNTDAFFGCEYLGYVNYEGNDWGSIVISEGNDSLIKAYENPGWQKEGCDRIRYWDFCNDEKTVAGISYNSGEYGTIVIRGSGEIRDYAPTDFNGSIETDGTEIYPIWDGNFYTDVYISKDVTRIGANTFDEPSNLTVKFEGTEEEWNNVEIAEGNNIGEVIFESELFGHDAQFIPYTAPICDTEGTAKNIDCDVCGYYDYDVSIPATHTDEDSIDGECDICGEAASDIIAGEEIIFNSSDDVFVFIPVESGDYTIDTDKTITLVCYTASEDGTDYQYTEGAATYFCAGNPYYISSEWVEDEYPVSVVFNRCSHENTVETEGVEPTCTSEGFTAGVQCADCGMWLEGNEYIHPLPHNYVSSETVEEDGVTCDNEGYIRSYCSVCQDYYDEWVPARCTDNNRDRICDVCGEKIDSLAVGKVYELEGHDGKLSYFIPEISGEYTISSVDSHKINPCFNMYDELGNYAYNEDVSDDDYNFSLTKELKAGVIYTLTTSAWQKGTYKIMITYTGEEPETESTAPVTNPTTTKPTTTTKAPVTAAPTTTTTTTAPTTAPKKEQPVKAKKPAKVTAKKPKSVKEKQIVVTWTKVKNANGYQVAYSTSKKFTKKTTKTLFIKKAKTTKTTLKKLKSGKKYFIKVRAYKTVNKKKVYGAYSKVMNVKVK